jgi:hypothetical protein
MNKGLKKARRCKKLKDAGKRGEAKKAGCPWAGALGETAVTRTARRRRVYRGRRRKSPAHRALQTKQFCATKKKRFYADLVGGSRRKARTTFKAAKTRGCAWAKKLPQYDKPAAWNGA